MKLFYMSSIHEGLSCVIRPCFLAFYNDPENKIGFTRASREFYELITC